MFVEEYYVSELFENVNDSYWFCGTLTKSSMDEHAAIKNGVIKNNQIPFMNCDLGRTINVKQYVQETFFQI